MAPHSPRRSRVTFSRPGAVPGREIPRPLEGSAPATAENIPDHLSGHPGELQDDPHPPVALLIPCRATPTRHQTRPFPPPRSGTFPPDHPAVSVNRTGRTPAGQLPAVTGPDNHYDEAP